MKALDVIDGFENPERAIQDYLQATSGAGVFICEYALKPLWLSDAQQNIAHNRSQQKLYALLSYAKKRLRFALIDNNSFCLQEQVLFHYCDDDSLVKDINELNEKVFKKISKCRKNPYINFQQGLLLNPVNIAKPWGKEVWFTGIEARGVSEYRSKQYSQPLPYLLQLLPEYFLKQQNLILLKILAPLSDERLGDLYFELHEEKREVYVVTKIDAVAWPHGKGGIRFGFSPDKMMEYKDQQHFIKAYLAAVDEYKSIRDQIDIILEKAKSVSSKLEQQEKQKRNKMTEFTHIKALALGDVIKVPQLLPHGLLHGVEVVEFQTPVYERKILSFGQKVLTQDHWDTREALDLAIVETAQQPTDFAIINANEISLIESIVEFDQFCVRRISTYQTYNYSFEKNRAYALLMVVQGQCEFNQQIVSAGQAVLFAKQLFNKQLVCEASTIILVAYPNG